MISVVKPILKYQDAIIVTKEVLADYRALDNDFHNLTISIKQSGKYDEEMKKEFKALLKKKTDIINKVNVSTVAERFVTRAFEKVNQELPPESFYIPEVIQ
ncbi:MAG: hypothetical protein HQL01_11820 [Nitrospirae bacterium]|nr:hypothetical protein [Nitrospirota bacterium]